MGDADYDGTPIGEQIIDTVWYGDAGGIGAEIVIGRGAERSSVPGFWKLPTSSRFLVSTYDGWWRVEVSQITQVKELIVAVGTVVGGAFLVVDAKGIAHLMEETGDRVGADDDAEVGQRHGNLGRRTPRPLQTSDGITSSIVFEQELDQGKDVGGFFSAGLRPPPERRVRPDVTF